MRNSYRIIVWLTALVVFELPLACFAQGTISSTSSFSTGVGATNSLFAWTSANVGPQTIPIGNQGICTIPAPPYPSCTLSSGSGTTADPFRFACSAPLPLSGCTLPGTPFAIVAGGIDFDTHVHTQTILAGTQIAPVPLEPWVPIGTAIGILLLVVARRSRPARR